MRKIPLLFVGFVGSWSILLVRGANPPEGAGKYYEMLRQRPQPGVVFERFADAWLADEGLEAMGAFLEGKAAAADAVAGDHFLLAMHRVRQGEDLKALEAFAKGLAVDAANARGWLEKARLEVRLLEFEAALKSLDGAAAAKPDAALAVDVAELRGRVLLRTGKPDAALAVWRELLQARPDDEELAEQIADVQVEEGLQSEAVATMRALIERTKDAADQSMRRLRLAAIFVRAADKTSALNELGACLAQSGTGSWVEAEALAQIDMVFRREDDLTGLAGHLEKMPEAGRPGVQQHLARVHADARAFDKALAIHANLLERTPGVRAVRESYLDLLERAGKYADAIAQTKLLIEQNAGDKELQIRLAGLHQLAGDAKAADAALVAYLAAKDTAEFDHLRVARQLEQWDRIPDAKAAFDRLLAAFPESAGAREAQAQFLHRVGDREAALVIWKDLAAKGSLEDLLAVAQTLLARLEPQATFDALLARKAEFEKEPRFLAPLITAAMALKKHQEAQGWALDRVRLTTEPALLDEAIRQTLQVLEGAAATNEVLATRRKGAPQSFPDRALLASLLEVNAEREEAEKMLREAPAGEAVLAQERLVVLIRARQDWPRAAAETEKLITMPGGRTSQHLQEIVDLKQRAGQPNEALKWNEEWKKVSPGAVLPWTTEAALLNGLGKDKESLVVLRSAARKFADDTQLAGLLATACVEAGQFADGERIFLRLLQDTEETPDKLRWVAQLAQVAASRGMLKAVTERFEERQRSNRGDATPWLALAEIHRAGNDMSAQRRCLEEAARLRPTDIDLLHQMARVDEDIGNWKQAVNVLNQAATLDKTQRSRQMAAMVQIRWGDESEGLKELIALLGGPQMAADDALKIADKMMRSGNWEAAETFLRPFVERDPADYRVRYCWAVAAAEVPQLEAALNGFVKVATVHDELPEVEKRKPKKPVANPYMEQYSKHFPTGAREAMEVLQSVYTARRHTFGQNYSQPQGGVFISVPPNMEAARTYALTHLMAMLPEVPEAVRAAALEKLKAEGLAQIETLLCFRTDAQSPWDVAIDEEALKDRSDDVLLHALWTQSSVSMGSQPNRNAGTFESYERAYRLLEEKYPLLATVAVLGALQADGGKAQPLLERVTARLEKTQGGDLEGFEYPISYLLGGGQRYGDTVTVEIPQATREKLAAILMRELRTSLQGAVAAPVFGRGVMAGAQYTANALRGSKMWPQYVDLWEWVFAEMKKADPARRKVLNGWATYAGSRPEPLLKPLEFPAQCGALPGLFASMMNHSDPINTHIAEWRRAGPEDDYAAVVPLLDGIKDPDLRVVLAYKANQMERVEKEFAARLADPKATVDDLILAGGFFGVREDRPRAVQALARCAALPVDAAQRKVVDAALVREITELPRAEREKLSAEILTAAQQAARRLRDPKLPTEHRDELVAALTTLGLKDEADQWIKLIGPPPAAPAARSYSSSSSSSSRDATVAKINTLAKKGDEPAALRLVMVELKRIQSQYMPGSADYARRQTDELIKKLSIPEASKKLEAMAEPPADAGDSRQMESAGLLEMMNQPTKALAIYERVFANRPNNTVARLRIIALTASRQPEKVDALLRDVPWMELAKGGGAGLIQLLRDTDDTPFYARMTVLEALTHYLDALSEPDKRPLPGGLDWAVQLASAAGSYDNDSEARLSALHERRLSANSYYRNANADAIKRRRAVHDALCAAVMKHPSIAGSAFASVAGLALKEEADLQPLVAVAERILAGQAAEKASGKAFRSGQPAASYSSNRTTRVWTPDPAEFLIWNAWKTGKPERIDAEILPLVERALSRDQARRARLFAALWTVTAGDYTTAAKGYVLAASIGNYYGASNASIDCLEFAMSRKLPSETVDALFEELNRLSTRQDGDVLGWYLRARISDSAAPEDMLPLVNRSIEKLIGPEAGWGKRMAAYAERYYDSNRSGPTDQEAYAVSDLVENLLDDGQTFALGARLAAQLGLMQHDTWRLNNVDTAIAGIAGSPADMYAFLQTSPMLGAAETFGTWGGTRDSPLLRLVSELKSRTKERGELLALLEKHQPQTFGVELVQAVLTADPAPPLSAMLKRRAADTPKIPKERLPEVTRLITNYLPAVKQPANLDPALKKALEPLMAAQSKENEEKLERWMKATLLAELKLSDSQVAREIPLITQELAMKDAAKAIAFFTHACDLVEAKEAQTGFDNSEAYNGWTLRSEWLRDAMEANGKVEMLIVMLRVLQEDASGKATDAGWSNFSKMGQSLMDVWRSNGGQGNVGRGLRVVCERLNKGLDGRPSALLALVFYDVFAKLPQSLRVPALRWAEGMKEPALAPFAKEMAMAGRLFFATDDPMRTNANVQKALAEFGGIDAAWLHYAERMKDEAENPRVRQALAHHLCYRARSAVPVPIVKAGASLALASMQQQHCISGYQYAWILDSWAHLPVDEDWKAQAQAHWDAWVARDSKKPRSRTLEFRPCDSAIHAMMRVAARAGNEEWMNELMSDHHVTLGNEPSLLAVLVGAGAQPQAVAWLKQQWRESLHDYEKGLLWSREIVEALPAFQEACGTKDLSFLGEVMLALLPDPPKADQAAVPGFKPRTARLTDLGKRFASIHWADPAMRTRCLEYLAQVYENYEPLAKAFDEAAAKTDMPAIVKMDDTWPQYHRLKPLRASISRKVWSGDPQAAIAAYDAAMAAPSGRSEYYKTAAIKETGWDPMWAVAWKLARDEKGDWNILLPFVDHLLTKTPTAHFSDHIADAYCAKLMIHQLAGKPEAVKVFRDSLTVDQKRKLESELDGRFALWDFVKAWAGAPQPRVAPEKRAELIAAMLADPLVQTQYRVVAVNAPNLMAHLTTRDRVFTPAELAQAWKPIAAALPRKGKTAAEASDLLSGAGKMPEAVAALAFAAEQTKADPGASAGFVLRQAELTERSSQKDAARKLLEGLDETKLGAQQKTQRQNLLKRLTTTTTAAQ